MSRKQLTAKQRAFLHYLADHIRREGDWPTYREIVDHFDFRSPNSVTQNLQALYRKGYLRRDDSGYRLLDDGTAGTEAMSIPVRGVISAGRLQEAIEENLGTITLETLFPNLHRIFAIRVAGQSMQGADIHDGDFVLLMDDDIPDGGIGAVLYNGETSLKRIFHDRDGLRLEPANDDFPNILIRPDVFEEVRVLGRYVGHVNNTGIHRRTTPSPVRSVRAYASA
jgi:repressor LexA